MTAETTRNEAAERLSDSFGAYPRWPIERQDATLTEALAAERRATVKRIRAAYWDRTKPGYRDGVVIAILDEEAAR